MARAFSVAQQNALAANHCVEAYLIEVDFPTGIQRYTTAGASIQASVFDPGTLGIAWAGGVSPTWLGELRETESGEAVGKQIKLSGVPTSQRALVLGEHVQGRRYSEWFAQFDPSTYAIIGTPVKVFEGRMDAPDIDDEQGGKMTITLSIESRAARMLRANERRYTDQDQQARWPGDTICRFTTQAERSIIWPAASFFAR